MRFKFLTLILLVATASCAGAKGFGTFPAVRSHDDQFLRRTFRLPVEALLDASTPSQLAKRASGKVPTFAAAPVTGSPANPFGAPAADATDGGQPEFTVTNVTDGAFDPVESATATQVEDPFADADSASADPFGDDPFGDSGDDDPFADAGSALENDDPFATPAGDSPDADDPFADF